jgi:hypothetical protein
MSETRLGWNLAIDEPSPPLPPALSARRPASPVSPRLGAHIGGAFYVISVLAAISGEALPHARWAPAAGQIAMVCFAMVTLILYFLFEPVSSVLAGLAALSNLVGLSLEALGLHLRGANVALIFHGLYCLLIGLLIARCTFVPRALGLLIAAGGLAWLTDLSIPLTNHLAPYNVVAGFVGEGLPMLWLLLIGVSARHSQSGVHAA